MILQARKHLQGLQAVNTQLFEKIVFWRERARRQLKMLGRQIEHLPGRLFERAHIPQNLSLSRKEEKPAVSVQPASAVAGFHPLETTPKGSKTRTRLRRSRGEPATATSGQRLRFCRLFHAEHFAIETAYAVFTSF